MVWAMTTLAKCFIDARDLESWFSVVSTCATTVDCPLSNAPQQSPEMDLWMFVV